MSAFTKAIAEAAVALDRAAYVALRAGHVAMAKRVSTLATDALHAGLDELDCDTYELLTRDRARALIEDRP